MQGYHAVATFRCSEYPRIVTRLRVNRVVPSIAFAGGGGGITGGSMVDNKMQAIHHAVVRVRDISKCIEIQT